MCTISPISQCIWGDFSRVFPCRFNTANRLHVALGDDAGPAISSPGMGAAHVFFGSGADSLYVRLVIGLTAVFGGRLVDNGFKVGRDDLDGGYA